MLFKLIVIRIKYKYNKALFKYYCFINDLVLDKWFNMRIANKALSYANAGLYRTNEKLWEIVTEYVELTSGA